MKIHSLSLGAIDHGQSVTWLPDLFGICEVSPDRQTAPTSVPTVCR